MAPLFISDYFLFAAVLVFSPAVYAGLDSLELFVIELLLRIWYSWVCVCLCLPPGYRCAQIPTLKYFCGFRNSPATARLFNMR